MFSFNIDNGITLSTSPTPSYTLGDLFQNSDSLLGKLIKQAQTIETLNSLFQAHIDDATQCRVGCYHAGVLTLFTDSAAFATRLRYEVPTLLSKLRQNTQLAGLCSIQIKIQPTLPSIPGALSEAPKPLPIKLSQENAEQLQALAASLKNQPKGEALAKSLERLAMLAQKSSP